jgi:MinD superfamily P-loop ATPase
MSANDIYPEIDAATCDGCGECLKACKTGALALNNSQAILAFPERCEYDAACEPVCPVHAINLPYAILLPPITN